MPEEKKMVVVYRSCYGSTKQYAEWLAEELHGDLYEQSEITLENLLKYDTIIYGGSLYAGKILGLSLIKNRFNELRNKRVVVFSVGASPTSSQVVEYIKSRNFTAEMRERVNFFYLRGKLNYAELKPVHKFMMFLMKKRLQYKKEKLNEEEKLLMECYTQPADWTSRKAIKPIVQYIHIVEAVRKKYQKPLTSWLFYIKIQYVASDGHIFMQA